MNKRPPDLAGASPLSGTYTSATLLERLQQLHPQVIDLSLGRMERLLAALDHPEDKLPPIVHVAGTNGKGSLIAFVRAIAEAMGKKAHVYTSPHLVDFHERVVLAGEGGGKPIPEADLVKCLARAEEANDGELITLFEITTAAAMLAFSEAPADLLLLETGLGGRLDATNVVEKPLLTVIMPVSIDHVSFLGDTIEKIAAEKAGILKPGVPCVVGRQPPEALKVIEARAKEIGAPLHVAGQDWNVFEQHQRLVFQTESVLLDLSLPRLVGRHQIENAGAAIAAASLIFGDELTPPALEAGLANAKWPARLERLLPGALYDHVDEGTEIWLDGGHNAAGGSAVALALAELDERAPAPLQLVWGMMEGKEAEAFLAPFKGLIERIYTVPIPDEHNSYDPETLTEIARNSGFEAVSTNGLVSALERAQADVGDTARILICGSLYLAGHALRYHRGNRA
ncbi:Folylpolyglutamate synthase [Methyloligella halotolerans]|uniref:tetrahydrofolate synthase n=1 Tax=Methyloligella halotolerans TaxID=1177755 RepID=A0A1E2RZZ2_9HYPH|nr:folylpolyglutamate synthase/dihydrofolate synthase family protein [Methyloligella halotolerans]ODA67781.1 Folylpolyglutamate synthase [Methyloligella halotolerans]